MDTPPSHHARKSLLHMFYPPLSACACALLSLQEDIEELPAPRMFWPRDVWGRYASHLEDFKEPGARTAAVQCLNHLVRGCAVTPLSLVGSAFSQGSRSELDHVTA
jgi:hypothetical protein